MWAKTWKVLSNKWILALIYVLAAVWAVLMQHFSGSGHNNFDIYVGVANHFFDQLPLYIPYPDQYADVNLYGPLFAFIIAPFAALPHLAGVLLWMITGALLLWWAVIKIPRFSVYSGPFSIVLIVTLLEFYNAAAYQQFNIFTLALIVLSFAAIVRGKEGWAALLIVIGTMVKVYGIVGLAFFFFIEPKRMWRFLVYLIFWSGLLIAIQILATSWDYVLGQYMAWIDALEVKNGLNQLAMHQNRGLVGMIRKLSESTTYSDLWVMGVGAAIFGASFLRFKQFRNYRFQLMMLSSALLMLVLFSSGTETSSYVTAMLGVMIWWVARPELTQRKSRLLDWSLLVFVIIGSQAIVIFPHDFYYGVIFPLALKALPFTLVWLRVSYLLCFGNFSSSFNPSPSDENTEGELTDQNANAVDVVLPLYNPHKGWVDIIETNMVALRQAMPNYTFRLILSNDGSTHGVECSDIERLSHSEPDMLLCNSTINRGKGMAVRSGVSMTTAPIVLYTDADFPYSLESMLYVLQNITDGTSDIAMAVRNNSYYKELSKLRKILSHSMRWLNSHFLGMKFPDAQGGLKAFNNKGRKVLLSTRVERFLFDTEFIDKAARMDNMRIVACESNLRSNVDLPTMRLSVIGSEMANFISIVVRR